MRPSDVAGVFTEKPDGSNWFEGNLNDALLYLDLRLHFDQCASRGPLPDGRLNWIVVRPRPDVMLFGRPLGEWTKSELYDRLKAEGFAAELPENGDIDVRTPYMGMSFDEADRLVWFEMG
jgi:hypothetical protein